MTNMLEKKSKFSSFPLTSGFSSVLLRIKVPPPPALILTFDNNVVVWPNHHAVLLFTFIPAVR